MKKNGILNFFCGNLKNNDFKPERSNCLPPSNISKVKIIIIM